MVVGRVRGRWDRTALRIKPFTETKEHFAVGKSLCAEKEGERRLLKITSSRPKDGGWTIECGLPDPAAADALVGAHVSIHPDMRPPLPEGQFYVDQLLGFQVLTEAGDDLGEIEEIIETPANLVFQTELAMVPDHPDFVVQVDATAKTVTVRDVEGLRT